MQHRLTKVGHTTVPYKYILNRKHSRIHVSNMDMHWFEYSTKKLVEEENYWSSDWEGKSNLWMGSYLERHRN